MANECWSREREREKLNNTRKTASEAISTGKYEQISNVTVENKKKLRDCHK